MASLLELSHELLHCIFTGIEPVDLSALSRTCKDLNSYIRGNRLLHKDLYGTRYDQPSAEAEVDWETEVHNAIKLEKILDSSDRDVKQQALGFVSDQIRKLLQNTTPDSDESQNIQLLSDYFRDTANIDSFLCASALFSRAGQQPAKTEELRQASAQLHCMYGVPIDEGVPARSSFHIYRPRVDLSPSSCTRLKSKPYLTHTYARSKVYDLRQYTEHTFWGPFRDDGTHRVDWEKVEAIMIVLGFNLRKFTERSDGRFPMLWDEPWVGASPNSYIAPPPEEPSEDKVLDTSAFEIRSLALSLDAQDPYGVSGTWMRVVCFLDYNDLYAFNFSTRIPASEEREPIDTEEGMIGVEESWQVTKIEPAGAYRNPDDDDDDEYGGSSADWSRFTGTRLPIVHFSGTSRSLHASWDPNANSKIRGTVRQTPEGEIRWTTFSIFHGEERWRSEGIQVGGLRSARGVLGNWFDKDYDVHGPAGPTAFWKETDELEEERLV